MSAWSKWVAAISNLTAWWRLGGSGPWVDEVGGIVATSTGSIPPTPSPGLLPFDEDGALYFGEGARLNAAMPALGSAWTWVTLIRADTYTSATNRRILALPVNPALIVTPTNVLQFTAASGNTIASRLNDITGADHMVAASWDGSSGFLYIDGALVGSSTPPNPGNMNLAAQTLFMSSYQGGSGTSGQWLMGVMDEPFFVARAMTAEEVASGWMALNASVPTAPQNVTATPGLRSATVSWDPPASDGGSPVTEYVVEWEEVGGA